MEDHPKLLLISSDGSHISTVGDGEAATNVEAIQALSQGATLLVKAGSEVVPSCDRAPDGWACLRGVHSDGPCAAVEDPDNKMSEATISYNLKVKLRDGEQDTFDVLVERNGRVVVETFEAVTMDTVAEVINARSEVVRITDSVKEKLRRAFTMEQAGKMIAANRATLAEEFGALIQDAQPKQGEYVDPVKVSVAKAKLRVFGTVSDSALGMRLSLMNRAQRLRYFSDLRKATKKARRTKA